MTYSQKLQDPRWQKLRLKAFERDEWKCQRKECSSGENPSLAVHHKSYKAGKELWEYALENFLTLCWKCHEAVHNMKTNRISLREGDFYSWNQLPELLGFEPRGYLTKQGKNIACGCFRLDLNPDAPKIVLPGNDQALMKKAIVFARQSESVPVFVKALDAHWEYCGKYFVEAYTKNKTEIEIHQARSKRKDRISMILFLEKVS